MIRRLYVEKKQGFDVEARELRRELENNLHIKNISGVRIFNRYDVENIDEAGFDAAVRSVFSEPPVDRVYIEELPLLADTFFFGMEYLPGQHDQRADSAMQCLRLLSGKTEALVRFAKMIAVEGELSEKDKEAVKKYMINPVDTGEADLEKPLTLAMDLADPHDVERVRGFAQMDEAGLREYRRARGLAMSDADLLLVQRYFRDDEKRDPSVTELLVLDTYWSDHCRHTTFHTRLAEVNFEEGAYADLVKDAFSEYLRLRGEVYGEAGGGREISLMDIAGIGAKYLKKRGLLSDLDESDEINACSIRVKADVDGKEEDWLVMFKNETHNHPTEIEPFGGAATCLGGAIRDPLSGRAYVYQAMRVTGSGDPRGDVAGTWPGKLSQYRITKDAAKG
ncbi:MAG: phosphoribosylformylglycinamidine synthase, partial [Clostridiales Family XIII bacterium]|nr:phosphoribosylformylglycinamidine synthase [Clostridiales Family XIII bacterium]